MDNTLTIHNFNPDAKGFKVMRKEKEGSSVLAVFKRVPDTGIGDMSDGYHTFNELYRHRAILFSVICNMFKEKAWKSMMHHDGKMYDGMFIVGIETPNGQATYHYDVDPYWNLFDVRELDTAPEWDGHTPDEAIERIKLLSNQYI